jgi:hypothetical protein
MLRLVITHVSNAPVRRNLGASVERKEAGSGSLQASFRSTVSL